MLSTWEPLHASVDPAERFDWLFERLYAELYGLVYRLLGDRQETEDVLQEAMLKLVDAAVLQRPDTEVKAWLARVSLNLASNRLRSERRSRSRLERVGRLELADLGGELDGPARSLLRQEAQGEARVALARLPERQRNCLLLRHSGYSYAEIAAALGIAVGSVGVLLARGERAFRETYLEQNDAVS